MFADIVRRRGIGGTGIGYADEMSHADRRRGVLWARKGITRGSGRPSIGGVHPLRQRQCMSHMLCQVCGVSTYENSEDGQNSFFHRWGERHLILVRASKGLLAEGEITAARRSPAPSEHEHAPGGQGHGRIRPQQPAHYVGAG